MRKLLIAALGWMQSGPPEPALLATLPEDVELIRPAYVDPNGVKRRDRSRPVFDDAVTRVAYSAWRGKKQVAVVGDAVVGEFDYLGWPLVPPAGQPVLFRAGDQASATTEKWWILVDGKKQHPEDWIGAVAASRDGARRAWWTQPGARIGRTGAYDRGKQVLVVDGKRGGKWDDADSLTPPLFSPDGSKVAAVAARAGLWFPIVVSKKGEKAVAGEWGYVQDLAWSPDSGELVFSASLREDGGIPGLPPGVTIPGMKPMKSVIVAGSRTFGRAFDACSAPVWSPDGRQVAYRFSAGGKSGLAVGDEERVPARFDRVESITWSDDSKHVACAVAVAATTTSDDPARFDFDAAGMVAAWQVAIDGRLSGEFDRIEQVAIAPGAGLVAFAAMRDGAWHVVAGERRSGPFDDVGPPRFTPDGGHLVFGALAGRELRREVLAVR